MRLIIAGSRTVTSYAHVARAMYEFGFMPTEVVSGAARGVDQLGEQWARLNGVACKRFPADWNKYGKSAGYRRNVEMAEYANALVAVWDGKSRGTAHMIEIAKDNGLHVFVWTVTR